jgi:hypothetical protein
MSKFLPAEASAQAGILTFELFPLLKELFHIDPFGMLLTIFGFWIFPEHL